MALIDAPHHLIYIYRAGFDYLNYFPDKFATASAKSTIRLNFSYAGKDWQFFAKYGNSDNPFKQIGNYNNISTMSVTDGGYVEFLIDNALNDLQLYGMKIHGNDLKITSIELR